MIALGVSMGKKENESYEDRTIRREKEIAAIDKEMFRREVTFDTNNYVVMANNMIRHSASNLTWNEFKLLRFFIMQTEKDDKELYSYTVSVPKLAEALELNPKLLYRELDKMTDHILSEPIRIGNSKADEWKKFNWVEYCSYKNGSLTIKLSEQLKPFLVDLRGNFTRYRLSDIVSFKSVFAGIIYEHLRGYLDERNLPHADVAIEISVSIEELRKITGTENVFERYSNFKAKVIDTALKEINQKSPYHVTATPYKDGRTIAGFDFLIESQAGYNHRTAADKKDIKIKTVDDDLDGQMNLMDYQTSENTFTITKG